MQFEFNPVIFGIQGAMFIALIFVLKTLFFDPLVSLLKKREELTSGRREVMDKLRQEVEKNKQAYQNKLTLTRKQLLEEKIKTLVEVRERTEEKLKHLRLSFHQEAEDHKKKVKEMCEEFKQQIPQHAPPIAQEIKNALLHSRAGRL